MGKKEKEEFAKSLKIDKVQVSDTGKESVILLAKLRRSKRDVNCDMRGMLSFMILFLLSRRSMYGQELAEEIERRKGEKPNPGTIYPALKELTSKGLVDVRSQGRTTIYKLTKEGKSTLARAQEFFVKAYGDILLESRKDYPRDL